MKKFFAVLLSLSLMLTVLVVPAMADTTSADTVTSATSQSSDRGGPDRNSHHGPMNRNQNSQIPDTRDTQAPDLSQAPDTQDAQAPDLSQAPDTQDAQAPDLSQAPDTQDAQAPDLSQAPDTRDAQAPDLSQAPDTQDAQAPDNQDGLAPNFSRNSNKQNTKAFNNQKSLAFRSFFEELLNDGIIDQNTYDTIMEYLKKNVPTAPDKKAAAASDTAENTSIEDTEKSRDRKPHGKPESANNSENTSGTNSAASSQESADTKNTASNGKPADTDNKAPGEKPADTPESDLIQELVDVGILTQSQADTILSQLENTADTLVDTDEVING